MMKGDKAVAVAVRRPDGKIIAKKQRFVSLSKRNKLFNLPFVRGVVQLAEMLVVGIRALIWSADVAEEKESEKLNKKEIGLTLLIAILLTIGIFVVLPYYAAKFLVPKHGMLFNAVDGIFRGIVFFSYLMAISLFKDMKRVFQYHGAEHKSVACFEAGKPLTPKNCKKFSKEHPRCGTSFLVYVIVVSIIVFSMVKSDVWYINLGMRILFIPLIVGVSYEILKLAAKFEHNILFKLLILPGLWTQKITTKEPDEKQLEVAIAALKKVID